MALPKHQLPATLLLLLVGCTEYEVKPNADWPMGGDTQDTAWPDCSEWEAPEDYLVPVDTECMAEPEVGSFNPVIEWQWNSNSINSGYDDIMSTPAIGHINDDNGDGLIDTDDIPDVVFTTFVSGAYTSPGALVAISGDGSGMHWSTTSIGGYRPYGSSAVAIGDLEGDGDVEICVSGYEAAVICVNGVDGSLLWANGTENTYVGAPTIADFDEDGDAEVAFGRQIFDSWGNLIGMGTGGDGYQAMSVAVDWDNDGFLELVAGNSIYEMDGSTLLTLSGSDGMPAIGDFDGDTDPDVVLTGGGLVRLYNNAGTQLWSVSVPGGGTGGPPTVADFDGDGLPEIGVAGQAQYTVFDTDGSQIWTRTVSDYSSSVTGSSVFDFEGDGSAEVVYADEHTLWIFSGASGDILMEQTGHASGTLYEYPLVADVDGDGATEIIVASNNYTYSGWNGITVIGDKDSSWAPAREVWNQFAYHITNVDADSSIPQVQTPNWLTWNNFRAGGTEFGPAHWQADLAPGDMDSCLLECRDGLVRFTVSVENPGLIQSSDFEISLRAGGVGGTEVASHTYDLVDSGVGSQTTVLFIEQTDWGEGSLVLVVDSSDTVEECDETDNVLDLGAWPCEE
jgi:hypothetical protein